jgi:hypothetical protein
VSAKAEDLDETRRLLYMALAAAVDPVLPGRTMVDHPELPGTLANALAHHRGSHTPKEAFTLAADLFHGKRTDEAWGLIAEITQELEEEAES